MSRSFKKRGIYCDSSPSAKKKANARVRRFDAVLANGSSYKKVYESWDICDYKFNAPSDPKAWRK